MSGGVGRRRPVSFLGRWTGRTKPGAISPGPRRDRWTSTRSRSATVSGCSTSPAATTTSRTCGCCARLTGSGPCTTSRRTRKTSPGPWPSWPGCTRTSPSSMTSPRCASRLDALADDQILHRLEDAARAGSLARYRNRQSVYQFSELGYRAYTAVEDVLRARVSDANLSRLVFSDILEDLRALTPATRDADGDQVYRRLSRLDTVLDDMSRRAAQFHLTLGEIMRSTDTSPETFMKYKNALLTHMTDFMAELDRYLPRLATAIAAVDADAMLALAARADDRPFLLRRRQARRLAPPLGGAARLVRRGRGCREHGRGRRGGVARGGPAHRHPRRRLRRHRAAPPGHRGAARRRQPLLAAPPPRRVGVRRPRRAGRARADDRRVQPPHRPPPRRRARRRRPGLLPRDLVGRARRGHLGHAVQAGQGTDARRPPAGQEQPGREGRAGPPPGRAAGRRAGRRPFPARQRRRTTACSTRTRPGSCSGCSPSRPRPARSSRAASPPPPAATTC